jgi:hypothetical protein
MLAWRGFNLMDHNSEIPWMRARLPAELASMYWWNYVVLTLTIISLLIAVTGVILYVLAAEPDKTREGQA